MLGDFEGQAIFCRRRHQAGSYPEAAHMSIGHRPSRGGRNAPGHRKIAGEPSLSHWGFAAHPAMALIVVVLLALTFASLETFLSSDQSLNALEAAMAIGGSTKPGPTK